MAFLRSILRVRHHPSRRLLFLQLLILPDSCYRLLEPEPWAQAGSRVYQDFRPMRLQGAGCDPQPQTWSATNVLGRLLPGDYDFAVLAWGSLFGEVPFTVPEPRPLRLLAPLFPVGGPFQLEIDGDAPTGFVLEASDDLLRWDPIATGLQTPTTVIDPDSPNLLHRFYRARTAQ